MSWNYRVIHTESKNFSGEIEHRYAIHEVYYNKNNEPEYCTENPVGAIGETFGDLKEDLIRYNQAIEKECLEMLIFEGAKSHG